MTEEFLPDEMLAPPGDGNGNGASSKRPDMDKSHLPKKGQVPPSLLIRRSKDEILMRRVKIKDMVLKGVPEATIARSLGVAVSTVYKDLTKIRRDMRKKIRGKDVVLEVAEIKEYYDAIARTAILEAGRAEKPDIKNAFMNTAMRAKGMGVEVLMRTGVLPPDVLAIADSKQAADKGVLDKNVAAVMENPESRRRVLDIFRRLLTVSGKDLVRTVPSKEVADAKFVLSETGGASGADPVAAPAR